MNPQRKLDHTFLFVLLFVLGFGLVHVYSASFIYATEVFGSGLYFFKKQLLFALLGVMVMLTTAYLPWSWLKRLGLLFWLVAVTGVALTLVPGLGIKVGGATRWLKMPMGLRFEPGELLKFTYPFVFAFLYMKRDFLKSHYSGAIIVLLAVSPMGLLLKQPDFGTTAICSATLFSLMFVMGLRWRYVLTGAGTLASALALAVWLEPYRMARIRAFLDPWSDPANKGFQIIQSMTSIHNGGFFGLGLGKSQGKLFYLPEAHTDFTLAIFGEEWGFIGVMFALLLFGFLILRGFRIALATTAPTQKLVALGVTFILGLSVVINFGVVMGILPTKGLTLPFLSYGGSSLVTVCFAMGILLNIDRDRRLNQTQKKRFYPISYEAKT